MFGGSANFDKATRGFLGTGGRCAARPCFNPPSRQEHPCAPGDLPAEADGGTCKIEKEHVATVTDSDRAGYAVAGAAGAALAGNC
jgi:hypothetical protein